MKMNDKNTTYKNMLSERAKWWQLLTACCYILTYQIYSYLGKHIAKDKIEIRKPCSREWDTVCVRIHGLIRIYGARLVKVRILPIIWKLSPYTLRVSMHFFYTGNVWKKICMLLRRISQAFKSPVELFITFGQSKIYFVN